MRTVQVLGIVSDDVAKTAEGFSQGDTTIVESGHTVVLNVNGTTEDMLRQVGSCNWLEHISFGRMRSCILDIGAHTWQTAKLAAHAMDSGPEAMVHSLLLDLF